MITESELWLPFILIVLGLLALDLGVFNKKVHAPSLKESSLLTLFYILISLLFAGFLYINFADHNIAYMFLTAYIVEKALSIDNLFVFLIIFTYFNVDIKYQHRILFWGIVGALITRGVFIFAGVQIIEIFRPILYVFGAFLIFTGIKLLKSNDDEKVNPENNVILKFANKYLPIKKDYVGSKFFTNIVAKDESNTYNFIVLTPLLIVLLIIESTDVLFAFDSVPAVLSISQDRFIIYTSNIFAILGLRALYFVIAKIMPMFEYLNYGLAIVLTFIGIKMILNESDIYQISTTMSLLIVLGCLTTSIIISLILKKKKI